MYTLPLLLGTDVHTHSPDAGCPLQGALTIPSPLSATVIVTEKTIHRALIPAVLCAAQLAVCRACLYNAAGPSTFHTPEALLATATLLHYSYKIPPHVSFDPFIPNTAFLSAARSQKFTVNHADALFVNVRHSPASVRPAPSCAKLFLSPPFT